MDLSNLDSEHLKELNPEIALKQAAATLQGCHGFLISIYFGFRLFGKMKKGK